MRYIVSLVLVVALALTGCASMGGSEGFATRVLAGLQCVGAITAAGGQVASDPDLGFSTAADAFSAINKVATGPGLTTAMAACADTFKYLADDVAGAAAMLKVKAETVAEPAAQRKARMSNAVPKAQQGPVIIRVPLQ